MNIYWTRKSKTRFQSIDSYIHSEFGKSSSTKFRNKVLNFLDLLSKFPELGTVEVVDKQIYGFQISRQTRIFYRIKKDRIVLLTFFDSRQNPDKRPN